MSELEATARMGNVQPVVVSISVIVVVVAAVAIEPHTHRAKLVIHMRFTATEAGEEGRHAGNPVRARWKVKMNENAFVFICDFLHHRQSIDSDSSRCAVQAQHSSSNTLISTKPRMRITQLWAVMIMCGVITSSDALSYIVRYEMKKARCLNPPRTARRVESVIGDCQEEVKNHLVNGE